MQRSLFKVRDKVKEEELHKARDPKYAHLNMDLHVFTEVSGPLCEAYCSYGPCHGGSQVISSTRYNDDICQEQFLELSYLNGVPEPSRGRGVPVREPRLLHLFPEVVVLNHLEGLWFVGPQ